MHPRQTTPWRRRTVNKLPYKVELCNKWMETGSCRYGKKCRFAHGGIDLRVDVRNAKNLNFKTQLCKNYHGEATTCNYGQRCHYIHDESKEQAELRKGCLPTNAACSGLALGALGEVQLMEENNHYYIVISSPSSCATSSSQRGTL